MVWRVSAKTILTRIIWELEISPNVIDSRREGKGWCGMLRPRSMNLYLKTAIRWANTKMPPVSLLTGGHFSSKAKQIRTSEALFRTNTGMSWKSELCLMSSLIWASQVARWKRIHLPMRRCGFHPWVRKIPWRRKWQLTPVILPGGSHGQRSLASYSPWGCRGVGHAWARMHFFGGIVLMIASSFHRSFHPFLPRFGFLSLSLSLSLRE